MVICSGTALDFEVLAHKIEQKRPLRTEETKASVTSDAKCYISKECMSHLDMGNRYNKASKIQTSTAWSACSV